MRISVPQQRLSLDLSTEWQPDESDHDALATYGLYVRSVRHGVFLNVRSQDPSGHALTTEGLVALLHEQNWASGPYDEWTDTAGALTIVGGTFETVGMGGEVVLEVFASDGRSLANLVGPGERAVIAALTPSVKRLASTLLFI